VHAAHDQSSSVISAFVDQGSKETRMSTQEREIVVLRWIEAWNLQDLDASAELLEPEFVRHDANLPDVVGPQAQRAFLAGVFRSFPDIRVDPQQIIAQGDLVAVRLTVQGTHRGEFLGVPATGQEVKIQSVDVFRVPDSKIAEQWVLMDALGLMQQLGAIPSPT
jgi:steroid delta-isomerase-like uncharacterized protein